MKLTDELIAKFNLKENTRDTMGVSRLYKLRVFDWFEQFNVRYMFLECTIQGLPIDGDQVMLMARGPRMFQSLMVTKELMTNVTPAFFKHHIEEALKKVRPRQHGYGQTPSK